jgi:hypothetical protein
MHIDNDTTSITMFYGAQFNIRILIWVIKISEKRTLLSTLYFYCCSSQTQTCELYMRKIIFIVLGNTYAHTNTQIHTGSPTGTHTRTHARARAHTHTRARTTHIHTYTQTHAHTHTNTYTQTHAHTHTHTHTRTYKHTRTHTHQSQSNLIKEHTLKVLHTLTLHNVFQYSRLIWLNIDLHLDCPRRGSLYLVRYVWYGTIWYGTVWYGYFS